MNDTPRREIPPVSVALARQVDRVCDQLEAAWQAGRRPALEDYLAGVAEADRAALLAELIPLDAYYRRRHGEQPRPEDYLGRFPDLDRAWLAQAIAAPAPAPPAAASHDAAPAPAAPGRRLRCPHCHNPIQLADDSPDEVLCPACGGSFEVRDARHTTTVSGMRPLGKFQLLERVGLGAFGAVWKARDTQLDRIVALKIPHAGLLTEKDELERFHREARAAAQLRHPGIVPVHEVQLLEGLPTLVADFIHGVTLKDLLATRRLTFREAATLVAEVAAALDYAHGLGLVHRDVKPANIMLDYGRPLTPGPSPPGGEGRETAAPLAPVGRGAGGEGLGVGRPLLMDFGLALRQEAEVTLTLEGQILGTPAYMSPEQAAGKGHQVDGRSDVYSLGVVLYELLTGELPFRGAKAMLLLQVLREEPRSLRSLNDRIPRDLNTICLKALAKAPGRRYATARELADDLRRWLKGEPIQARPVGAWERGWTWAKRKPAAAGLLVVSAVAALALVGGVVGWWFHGQLQEEFQEAQRARKAEEDQRRRAEAALAEADFQRYFRHIALAHAGWREGSPGQMEWLLDHCPTDRRNWEWNYLQRLGQADLLTLRGHDSWVTGVAFSPDGKQLASSSSDRTVKVWDGLTGELIRTLRGHTESVLSVAFSPDGTQLASASGDRTARVWDAATGQPLHRPLEGHTRPVLSVAFSPDGTRLASASTDTTVKLWDMATGKEILTFRGHAGEVGGLAFSPDGTRLASASADQTVKVWDARRGGSALLEFKGHRDAVRFVAFSPDGTRLASSSTDRTVKVWDTATAGVTHTLKDHPNEFSGLAFSPDGARLAVGSSDHSVKVWDLAVGQEFPLTLRGHTGRVAGVAFSPDGTRLASASTDGTVKVRGVTGEPEARTFRGHTRAVQSVVFDASTQRLASASADGTLKIWDTTTGQEILTCRGQPDEWLAVAFRPDGTQLASAGRSGTVRIWNAATGQEVRSLPGHTGGALSVAFNPDGTRLASAGNDGTVRIWDLTTGVELLTPREVHGGHPVRSVAFSPDGRRLASSSSQDRSIKVWEVATGRELFTRRGKITFAGRVAFSADGNRLASAEGDTGYVWDWTTGEEILTLRGHSGAVVEVVFSPDGTRLASASQDGTVKVWDATTGQEVLTLRGHTGRVWSVAFRPDGYQLATAGADQTIQVWDARPLTPDAAVEREALALLDALVSRPLARADVAAYLRQSGTIRESARRQALALLDRYREEADPERYHQAAWAVVRQPYLNAFPYGFALRQAAAACRLTPEQGKYRTALGAAQYRVGRYKDALTTLTQAQPLHAGSPMALAFLALTQHRLGQQEQAQATLTRLRETMKEPAWAQQEEAQALLREAKRLLLGQASESKE